jgi:hypothetical protein
MASGDGDVRPESGKTEQVVDLAALGQSGFNPYVFDRNPIWALLPVVALIWVLFHLQKKKKVQRKHDIRKGMAK